MKRLKKIITGAILGVTLLFAAPGCSTIKTVYDAYTTPVDMTSVRKSALSVNLAYNVALDLANAYASFPSCGSPAAPVLCADLVVIDEMVRLDTIAATLIEAMNKTVQSPNVNASVASAAVEAAKNAVAAFKAVLPAPTVK